MSEDALMVSVSGLRGIVGTSLTPEVAARFAAAYGGWLLERGDATAPHVVIGRDSRPSGPELQSAVAGALTGMGCRVTTLGVATTPGVGIMTVERGAQGGIVITASHNPDGWNGVKLLRADGAAPPAEQARQIIARFEAMGGDPVRGEVPETEDRSIVERHAQKILQHIDAEPIRRRRPKIVLDSVCGAGGPETARLLEALGVQAVHLNAEPTGAFPHPPEPTEANLRSLCDAVREHGAEAGFAQDPDADRLALVDERGRYIGEEYTLALCAMRVLDRKPGPAVANLSTSRMIDDVAGARGCAVHRTPVGEANVAQAMRDRGAVIGGEGNGGVIWPAVSCVRDSLVGIALILELMAVRRQSLGALADSLPRYVIVKEKQPADGRMTVLAPQRLREAFAGDALDLQDGVRVDTPEGWVHVRASNTEPILRFIAEAKDADGAHALIEKARAALL